MHQLQENAEEQQDHLEIQQLQEKAMQSHYMTVLQFQYQAVRKFQFPLPLVLLNPLIMVNLR